MISGLQFTVRIRFSCLKDQELLIKCIRSIKVDECVLETCERKWRNILRNSESFFFCAINRMEYLLLFINI